MSSFETVVVTILALILAIWLAIAIGAIILIWRVRKVILGVSIAVSAITEVGKQVQNLTKTLRDTKIGIDGRTK